MIWVYNVRKTVEIKRVETTAKILAFRREENLIGKNLRRED